MTTTHLRTLVLLLKDDQILLARKKRGFGEGYWNGYGGKLESGETIEQAMVRECQEESGVTPLQFEKVAIHDFRFPGGELDMQGHVYVCREWEGTPVETEEMAPQWFALNDIPYVQMWQDDIFWLPAVLQGKKLLGQFVFDVNDTLLSAELEVVAEVI